MAAMTASCGSEGVRLTNWDERQVWESSVVVRVRSERDVVDAVNEARARGLRVRATGARLSYSALVCGDAGGVSLDLSSFDAVVGVSALGGDQVVEAQAGIRLRELQRSLHNKGFALATTTAFGDERGHARRASIVLQLSSV